MRKLPDVTQEPIMNIDSTPNDEYPLRILRVYRQNCDCRWSSDTENALIKGMNEACEQRAKILDKAITILEQVLSEE